MAAVLFPRKQPAFPQYFLVELAFQAVAQQESGIRRVANAKQPDRLFVQAPPGKILPGMCTLGPLEILLEKCTRSLVDFEQDSAQPGFLRLDRTAVIDFGQRDAQLLGDGSYGFWKSDVFNLLNEAEDVTGSPATEAVIELFAGVDIKRRGFFAVKGAKPGVILRPRFLQPDIVAYDADNIRLLLERVREIARVSHDWVGWPEGIVRERIAEWNIAGFHFCGETVDFDNFRSTT